MLYIFIILLNIFVVIITVKLTIKANKKEVEALKKELDSAKNQPVHIQPVHIIRESRPLKRLCAKVEIPNELLVHYPDGKLQVVKCLAHEFEKNIEKGLLEEHISIYEERSPINGTTVYTAEIMIG